MIFLFTCDRKEMLLDNLKHLDQFGQDITVIDDNSNFDLDEVTEYADVYRSEKRLGKKNYWLQWRAAFNIAANTDDDLFIFMPDDFLNLDFEKINELHEVLKTRAYSFNIINDGREQSFRYFVPRPQEINGFKCTQIGFNDCGFFCNRAALRLLNFRFDPVTPDRFNLDPFRSSGVGEQLTIRMRNEGVFMLMPEKSLAHHGDHESIMHPIERRRNPLISK